MKIYASRKKLDEIQTVEQWFKLCPPKKAEQWVDLKSAKEMAVFWTDNQERSLFQDFVNLRIGNFMIDYIIPEYASRFDNFKNGRKHDLFIKSEKSKTIVTVEGKSGESFGTDTFEKALYYSKKKSLKNHRSKKENRILQLLHDVFRNNSEVLKIKYQLAYWFAASIYDAFEYDAEHIVLVVQEFRSSTIKPEKLNNNHAEYCKLIHLVSEKNYLTVGCNEIIGPINNEYTHNRTLYFGKYVVEL